MDDPPTAHYKISNRGSQILSVGIYNTVEQEVMAGQFHAPSHPGVLKKNVNMNGNILQRYFTHKNFEGCQ